MAYQCMAKTDTKDRVSFLIDTPEQQSFIDEREFVGKKRKHTISLRKGVVKTKIDTVKKTVEKKTFGSNKGNPSKKPRRMSRPSSSFLRSAPWRPSVKRPLVKGWHEGQESDGAV